MAEIDFFHNTDGEEEIRLCLSCKHVDCINCLALKKEERSRPGKGKRVDQYALDGTFIKTWPTLTDAAQIYHVRPKTISRSCRMGSYPVKGYIWKFHEEGDTADV